MGKLRELGVYVHYEYDDLAGNRTLFFDWRDWSFDSDLLVRDFFEDAAAVHAAEFDKYVGPAPMAIANPQTFWNSVHELPALKGLTFANRQVTPDDLRKLENCRQLEELYLVTAEATDDHLAAIGQMKSLRQVTVGADWWNGRQANISHIGIDQLAALPNLVYLGLSGTSFDDRAARSLARLEQLECLDLIETEIGDEGLPHLTGLKNLKSINITSTRVTQAGADAFQAAMPNCKVKYFLPKK